MSHDSMFLYNKIKLALSLLAENSTLDQFIEIIWLKWESLPGKCFAW